MNDPKQTNTRVPGRTPSSRPSPSKSPGMNGTSRTASTRGGLGRSPRGGAARSTFQTSSSTANNAASDEFGDEDAKAEHAALLEELRSRVQKAEIASEEYQKQLSLLQARLDESQQSHGILEDQLHQKKEQVEELEAEKVQAARQKRDIERLFDEERSSMIKDREEQKQKEDDLQGTITRLRENLTLKDRELTEERSAATSQETAQSGQERDQFAPTSARQSGDTNEYSKTLDQKEKAIKSLRLELAEAQIKIMEIDSMGDGKFHELEKALMDAKIANARLTEDNESFQLLLSERTLNGDFTKADAMQASTGLGSLAEELGTEDIESAEGKSEDYRRLEMESKSLKDQNKALALYIENIIGRLLSHKEFENLLDRTPDLISGKPMLNTANMEKDLPPPPPEKDTPDGSTGSTFLQRARSVVAGPAKPRPRPISQISQAQGAASPVSPALPTGPTEDPSTAPSIPLGRSGSVRTGAHKRTQSDMPNAAPIVNQMYRGPPSSSSSGGGPLMSPGLSSGMATATRTSFFTPPAPGPTALPNPNPTPRAPSGSGSRPSTQEQRPGSSSGSTFSDRSGGVMDSPPRSNAGGVANNYTGAVMTQNRLRPLRLVQENPELEAKKREEEAVAARKKANRGSWMPAWMGQRNTSGGDSFQ